jgi:hypothetical protein
MRHLIFRKISATDRDHWGTARVLGIAGATACAAHPQRFPALVYVVQPDECTVEYAFEVCCPACAETLSQAIDNP